MKKIIAGAAIILLTGCASIVDGQNQSLSVQTTPVAGAQCKLTNSKGQWFVNPTPGSVTVHRAYGDMTVDCHEGNYAGVSTVKSSTKGMAFGNVVFGGVVGGGVDAATGAAYDYPPSIIVPMTKM